MQPKFLKANSMKFKENHKTALAKVLSDLVQCDGLVNQGEIDFLKKVNAAFHITSAIRKKATTLSLSDAVRALQTLGNKEKIALLHLFQQLSLSDDSLDPNESLLTTAVILSIGIELPETSGFKAHFVSIPNLEFDTRNAVLYVEAAYDKDINDSIKRHYKAICQLLQSSQRDFFYLPQVIGDLRKIKGTFRDTLSYIDPTLSDEQVDLIDSKVYQLDSAALSKEIFLNYLNTNGINLSAPAFFFKIENLKAAKHQDFLILEIHDDPLETLHRFYKLNASISSITPTGLSEKEATLMQTLTLRPTKTRKNELQYTGFHKILIDTMVKYNSSHGLSRLFVTSRGDLFLTDRNNTEVKMPALSKALYILFLFHQEGISLTYLNDYKTELYKIYRQISNYGDEQLLRQAVDNLTDYVGSTMNSTLSRIKRAFQNILGEEATYYLIQGEKGGRKTIHLDRSLVVFEDKKGFE